MANVILQTLRVFVYFVDIILLHSCISDMRAYVRVPAVDILCRITGEQASVPLWYHRV